MKVIHSNQTNESRGMQELSIEEMKSVNVGLVNCWQDYAGCAPWGECCIYVYCMDLGYVGKQRGDISWYFGT